MLNANTNERLMSEGGLPQTNPQIPDSSKFEFQSVYDFFSPPDTPEFNQIMDPEYENMLRQHAQQINSYAPAAIGNLNTPTPTLSSETYNPTKQRTGYNLSTPDGIHALLNDFSGVIKSDKPVIANPIAAGIRESNFDRYYKHPKFSKLGWHPYADNESFYNANSSWWDDFGRMSTQFGNLASTGFVSSYRSIGDLFDSDSYFSGTDMESASEFSDAMRIGNSTRGGVAGFANNLALQFGYTAGIIGSIAVEELALSAGAALQGYMNPLADAALAGRTALNMGRLGRSIAQSFDVTRFAGATRNMYNTLRSVDAAKDFYSFAKTGGRIAGQIFAPETYRAIKTLNSTANGAQNLTNMAKVSKTFGGFYRDLRSLNLALSESKMEGGMVYAQQLANNYDYYSEKNNGTPVTEEQMGLITENASRAAYWTTLQNAPTIFFSNQLLLGNAFGAYNKSLSRILNDNVSGLAGRVIRAKGITEAGKAVTRPFIDAGTGLKGLYNTVKAAGVRGSVQMGAHASLRYFAANLSEGIQELTQEAIAHGTKDYHLEILKDPASGGKDLLSATIASAVGSQFNSQGFETFMSGFLMGGLAQGPQKLLFQGLPSLYQRTFEKEKFEEYKKNKETYINNLVNSLNDAYEITANDPMSSIFDTNKVNLVSQKQASDNILQSIFDDSEFDFVDAKDFSKFQSIYTVLSSGKASDFKAQFRDYLKMTNEELAQIFPASKKDIKSGKLASRMQDMINKIDQLEDSFNENKNKFQNPFNSSIYRKGTREYNEERIKEMSFEHARYLYMFTEDGFKRALERSKLLYDDLASDPIVGKMAASDITVLLDQNSLAKEIKMLLSEISVLDPKENKEIIEAKTNKLKGLDAVFNVLYAKENLNAKGNFDKRKINKLRKAFETYVQLLAKSNGTFADQNKIKEALKKIIDYKDLSERANAYNKSIEYMNNPDRFDEIRLRAYEFYKSIFRNRAQVFKESLKNYISKSEINQFLNELDKLNVIPDPEEVKIFMQNGDINVLQNFYSESGLVGKNTDPDIYDQIQGLINIYKSSVEPTVTEKPEDEATAKSNVEENIDALLESAKIDDAPEKAETSVYGTEPNINPFIKKLLEAKYRLYVGRQISLGKSPVSQINWLKGKEAESYLNAYKALKKVWYNDLKNSGQQSLIETNGNFDIGFEEWLKSKQDDPIIDKVFDIVDLTIHDFIKIPTPNSSFVSNTSDKVVDDTFDNVVIIENKTLIDDPDTGLSTQTSIFTVRTKAGQLIEDAYTKAAGVSSGAAFSNISKAREAAKKLDPLLVENTPFKFGDKEVFYGSSVYDKNGDGYVVIGTAPEVQRGGKLFLLPFDKIKNASTKQERNRLAKKVTEDEFTNDYVLDEFNFSRLSENTSKLLVDEAVGVYSFRNANETEEQANLRLQTILENLTPEEKKFLLVIKRNPKEGVRGKYKIGTKDENPYINKVAEPFSVGLTFADPNTRSRINNILSQNGIELSSDPNGVFGFVRTGSVQFVNKKNEVINPVNLPKEIIDDTFKIYESQEPNAVTNIRNNFAIQQAFVDQIADKMEGVDSIIIPANELPEFSFNIGSSVYVKNKSERSIYDLKYNTVDGVRVLMINDKLKDGTILSRILTDIDDIDESNAFVNKLESDLKAQPGLFEVLQKSQRYVLLIKSPNGLFTGAPLKTNRLSDDQIFELGRELIKEGIRTINENLVGEGSVETKKIKDPNFNIEFNRAFNKKFYITTNIEGYTVEINVNSDGTFRAELYDKNAKKVIGTSYINEGRQGTLDYQDVENPDIIERLLDNLQKKGIDKATQDYKEDKKKDPSLEIPEWTKLEISKSNVRDSFQEDATVDTVINNTVTNLDVNVRTNYKLRLNAGSNTIQEVLLFAATPAAIQQENKVVVEETPVAPVSEIEAKKADIERRRKISLTKITAEQAKNISGIQDLEGYYEINGFWEGVYITDKFEGRSTPYKSAITANSEKELLDNINAKYDAELVALEGVKPAPIAVTTQEVTAPLKRELQQNQVRIKEIEAEIDNAESDMVKASQLMEDNAERQKLIARNREIQRKLLANKIVSKTLSEQEVADIDEFVIWANNNLPNFITVEDISNLRDNLVTNGVRVGAFVLSMNQIAGGMTVKGTLYTGAKSPYKYHEAFHGVFRSLLSNTQQDKLYKIAEAELKAKLGNKFEEELSKFRNSADSYKAMSRKALEKEFYEEYMADEFDKFKMDPRSTKANPAIKNFFTRLIEWIKSLFSSYSPNELQELFKNIDSGKFKSASPINNRFTDSLANGITLANKIIPVEMIESETGAFGYRTLDNDFARSLISSISARVIMLEQENKNANFNLKEAVNDSFNRFRALYSTKREAYKTMELTPEQKSNLRDIEKAFSDFSDFIKEGVYDQLKYYDIKTRNVEDDLEDLEEQVGDRLRTTDQYDKDVTSIGGFSSLSSFLRKYIGTTSISEMDQFGNEYLIDQEKDINGNVIEGTGEKLLITVDFATAYNGFLKAVKNINDPIKILQRLYFFGINNPQTQAVVNKLFLDLGIKWEGQLENDQLPQYSSTIIEKFRNGQEVTPEELKEGINRPLLFQAVLKGFENARVDYLFIHRSPGDKVTTYTAANRDDANTQVDRWGQAYIQKFKRLKTSKDARDKIVKELQTLGSYLQFVGKDEKVSKKLKSREDDILLKDAINFSKVIEEYLGISLSPKFIEFSIAKNLEELTPYQKALLNANSNAKVLEQTDVVEITKAIASNQNLFTIDEGVKIRLKVIALSNAEFDENVGASVFKNPNGDLVYAHQLPSFHLKKVNSLNDITDNGAKIEKLKNSDDYLKDNFLLNSEAFKQLSAEGKLRVLRISGSKIGNIDFDEDGLMSETSGRTPSSGTTYGDSTPREFILNLINSYNYDVDSSKGKLKNKISWAAEDKTINVAAIAPVLLRVLESSNTGDMMALPVFKAVEKNSKGETVLTDQALDAILNNIAAEFTRIQKESNPETATQELYVGYNALAIESTETGTEEIIPINVNSPSINKARAFNFHKTGVLLSPLGQKKESRQGIVTIQTSDIKLERIEKGKQTSLIYDQKAAEQFIGFTSTGVVRDAIVKTKDGDKNIQKKIIGRGLIRVTPENRERIFEDFKGSISLIQNDQFKYEVRIGNKKFYVESINEQKFLQGKKPMYMYDLMEVGEAGLMDQVTALIGGFEAEGYLDKLTEAARSQEFAGLTFMEAIQKLGIKESELKGFLQNRMNQEFAEFNITLDELVGAEGGLGNFLTNGIQSGSGTITTESREAGRLLNIIPEDKAYNLKQIFFNDYINTTAINQILLGDSAYSLKDAVDEIKRAKAQSASYYSAASTVAAPEYGIYKPLQEISLFELTEPIVNSTHNTSKIKNADAQLWMTTKAFRNFQYGFGKLTPAQAALFDKIENGDDVSADDIFGTEESTGYAKRQEMLNSQKLVYADGKTFVKMSAFPLLPQFTSIKDSEGNYTIPKPNKVALHNLRVKLEAFEKENDTVSVAAPRSALKMMQKNVSNIHSVTGTTNPLSQDQSVTLNANYLGLQVINPSNKTVITDPTQVKTLVTSEQNDSTEVIVNGKKITLGEVRAAYHKATRDRGNLNYINKRNLIFSFDLEYAIDELHKSIKENAITADLYTYLRYAEASLASTGSSSHLMELFSLDESGNQKYNLNNPLTYDKFLNLFMSYFSKSVFNEKLPGATISLVSDYGVRVYRRVLSVDENGMPDKYEIITEAQYEAMANKPGIAFNIDEGSYPGNDENLAGLNDAVKKSKGAGVVIIDRLRHNMKEYDSNGKETGQRYGEMILPPHHKEVMEQLQLQGKSIPDVVGKMFAVRIPSQDNHSTYNVKWIDFMPAIYGSSGVFARELIEISGADFDIDKLYTQFKEFYLENNKFKEYGKATTDDAKYIEYINYVNKKVKDSDSIYSEALYKYNGRGVGKAISITYEDLLSAKSRGFTENSINALLVLGMPVTLADYKKYKEKFRHEPYAAAINNDILDYKFALMGNDYVTERKPLFLDNNGKTTTVNTGKPALDENGKQKTSVAISHEAADMEVLKDLWNELKEELPEWAALSEEEGIDVDNLYGKLRMFANNKEGSRSIGAVVLPNLYLNLLQEYDVKIESTKLNSEEVLPQIEFGGFTFRNFNNTFELNEDTSQGKRTQYIISALITAATDNAKERLLAKLGLNINALSIVANLTALGVPIKTSVLLVNHPVIRQAYFMEANAPADQKISARSIVQERISALETTFLEEEEKKLRTSVTQNSLMEAIETPLIKANATEGDMIELRESNEVTKMQVIDEISILEQFLNAYKLANTTRYMGDILSLTNGLGQGLEAIDKRNEAIKKLGLNLSKEQFSALGVNRPMIDARPVFKGLTWQAGYLERFQEFTNLLLPKVVLSTTPLFRTVTEEIAYQTTVNSLPYELKDKTKTKIAKDFLSYLTIKAYIQNGLVNNSQSIATLTNGLIYNQDGIENITKVLDRLRSTEEGANNYFLNSFIITEKANLKGNKTGLNLAGANTFLRYNDSQKLDIQNGFMALYADPLTRSDAKTIVHYMMVKDGLQYGYKSIVEAVAPIAIDNYLSHIDTVQAAIERPNDTIFKSTFGMSIDDLVIDFMKGYLTSSINAYIIKKVRAKVYDPETKIIGIESNFTKELASSNSEAIFVFGDNFARQGTVGNSSIRGLDNAFSLFFKKDMNRIDSSYYTDDEAGDFITIFDEQMEQLTNMIAEEKKVILPKELISSSELADFKKNSPVVFDYVKSKLLQEFQYNIETKEKKSDEEKKAARVSNVNILKSPVHVDSSGVVSKLVVNLYTGISRLEKTNAVTSKRDVPSSSKLTKKFGNLFIKNKKALYKAGFRNLIDFKKGSEFYTEVEFPIVIRQNVGSDYKAIYKYYVLARTQSLIPSENLINYNNKAVGSYAEYVEVDIKGSNAQNPIGFMFGDRPNTKDLREFVKEVNSDDANFNQFDDEKFDSVIDKADYGSGVSLPVNSEITANEKGIQVNGQNISKVKESSESFESENLAESDIEITGDENLTDIDNNSINISASSFFASLLENEYSELKSWWDQNIDGVSDEALQNKNKIKELTKDPNMKFKVNDYDDFLDEFKQSGFQNEKEFIEHFKNCYL
jgi:hypothetical protein